MKQMIRWILAALSFMLATGLAACADDTPLPETETPVQPGNEGDNSDEESPMNRNIAIEINGISFSATLTENEAARVFASMLPLTIQMSELNGNEKYYYLDNDLPTDSYRPGTIQTGDLMLYGSSCVVLFYETFSSGYNYTRLGRIDNPEGLADVVGTGAVTVRFAAQY